MRRHKVGVGPILGTALSGDDRWCAIGVFTDEEWRNFCGVLNNTEWAEDSALATVSGRLERADELDRLIGEWTLDYSAEQVMTLMQAAGVAAGVAQNSKDLHEDPQLKYRNHYWVLDHPETGPATYDSPSYRLSKTPAQPRMPAPCLGEHNELVCSQMLGMSDEEFVELVAEGVFE